MGKRTLNTGKEIGEQGKTGNNLCFRKLRTQTKKVKVRGGVANTTWPFVQRESPSGLGWNGVPEVCGTAFTCSSSVSGVSFRPSSFLVEGGVSVHSVREAKLGVGGIEDGVDLAHEDITHDPQGASRGRDIDAHHAEEALHVLVVDDVVLSLEFPYLSPNADLEGGEGANTSAVTV